MTKINEQIKMLQDLEYLITKMHHEIERLRNINYRYYLMHGEKIQSGKVFVPDNISFNITLDKNLDVECKVIDHDKLGIANPYQQIQEQINKLK
jgi:hypothetical protein